MEKLVIWFSCFFVPVQSSMMFSHVVKLIVFMTMMVNVSMQLYSLEKLHFLGKEIRMLQTILFLKYLSMVSCLSGSRKEKKKKWKAGSPFHTLVFQFACTFWRRPYYSTATAHFYLRSGTSEVNNKNDHGPLGLGIWTSTLHMLSHSVFMLCWQDRHYHYFAEIEAFRLKSENKCVVKPIF